MRRRALLVVSVLDGTGPGRVMTTLAEDLPRLGVEPLLVATHGPLTSSLIDEATEAGVQVDNLRMRGLVDPAGVVRLAQLVRRWRPHVVHTRTIRADLVGRVAAGRGTPVVNNVVNFYPDDCLAQHGQVRGRGVMALARATRRAARLFVANAQAVADNTRAAFGVPPDLMRVVYDGIRLERWRVASPADLRADGVAPADPVCLTVARLHPQKGLDDLVAAAPYVSARVPRVRFVVAGDGPARDALRQQIRAAGLERTVILLGHRNDVPNLLARSRLFVLPSRFEGLPSAAIEAMAAGRPVVATSVAGVPELVEAGVTGWLVPPQSPRDLAEAVARALETDLEAVGAAARQRACSRFSAPAMAEAFAGVYEEALDGA